MGFMGLPGGLVGESRPIGENLANGRGEEPTFGQ
jgi:hypothetical protein